MPPIALTHRQMAEVRSAAMMVPLDLRSAYLERLAIELRGKDLGGRTCSQDRLRRRSLNRLGCWTYGGGKLKSDPLSRTASLPPIDIPRQILDVHFEIALGLLQVLNTVLGIVAADILHDVSLKPIKPVLCNEPDGLNLAARVVGGKSDGITHNRHPIDYQIIILYRFVHLTSYKKEFF